MSKELGTDELEDGYVPDEEVPRFIPPWYAQPNDDADQDEAENYIVMSYCYSDENPIICVGHKHWPLDKEAATLISAAPDYHAAVENLLSQAVGSTEWCAAMEALRAAHRKANGEKP